jgi:flagellar biosynthesis/type III secretory pathway ATPase
MATYEESRDLVELGAYAAGTNPSLDRVMRARPEITGFLRQDTSAGASFRDAVEHMTSIAEKL